MQADWFTRVILMLTLATVVTGVEILAEMLPKIEQQLAFNATIEAAPRTIVCVRVDGGEVCSERLGSARINIKPARRPAKETAI